MCAEQLTRSGSKSDVPLSLFLCSTLKPANEGEKSDDTRVTNLLSDFSVITSAPQEMRFDPATAESGAGTNGTSACTCRCGEIVTRGEQKSKKQEQAADQSEESDTCHGVTLTGLS